MKRKLAAAVALVLLLFAPYAYATPEVDEAATQYEALDFFSPDMSVKELSDLTAQLGCLKVYPRPTLCLGYDHEHHPDVIDRAIYIAWLALGAHQEGGIDKSSRLILSLQEKAEADLSRLQKPKAATTKATKK